MLRSWQSIGWLILAAALAVTSQSAGGEWDEFHIKIDPTSPTDKDAFDLRAWHWFTDSGYLRLEQSISVSGNQIDVRALIQDQHTRPDSVFLTVMTPEGAFFDDLEPLAAGTYQVNAEVWLTPWPSMSGGYLYDQGSLVFTVTSDGANQALPGDFNRDNVIDAGDYVAWRNAPSPPPNDYDLWRSHFGQNTSHGVDATGFASISAVVPEPVTAAFVVFGLLVVLLWPVSRPYSRV